MKRIFKTILLAISTMGICSCEEVHSLGGWYHVIVPDEGRSNIVIMTVDPHDDTKARQAVIEMQAGNAFAQFSILQQ